MAEMSTGDILLILDNAREVSLIRCRTRFRAVGPRSACYKGVRDAISEAISLVERGGGR